MTCNVFNVIKLHLISNYYKLQYANKPMSMSMSSVFHVDVKIYNHVWGTRVREDIFIIVKGTV